MSDPIRLLDDPSFRGSLGPADLSPDGGDARRLLELGRDVAPPAGAQMQVWSGLQSVIGGAAAGAALATPSPAASAEVASQSSAASPAATKTSAALGTKLGLVGVVVGAALFATTMMRQPSSTLSETPPAASFAQSSFTNGGAGSESGDPHAMRGLTSHMTSNPPVAPKEEPVQEAEWDAPTPSAPRAAAPVVTPTAEVAAPVDRVSQLQDESAAVQQARSQLASNNASGALSTLRQLDVDVPRGILGQERTVLTIEALKKSGQGAAAAQRAAAFIEANPKSPYAERLRAYLQ
jgi:hypothetical protein